MKKRGGSFPRVPSSKGRYSVPTEGDAAAKARKEYRPTDSRRFILDLLRKSEDCLTVDEIHSRLRSVGRRVGLATVYRSVNLLTKSGEVQQIDVGDGTTRYEPVERTVEDHHHHLVCRSCHRVLKYNHFSKEELELMKKTERTLTKRFGYRITGHRIYFEGVCPECQKKQ